MEYIYGAKVVIADLTEKNANVLYETGLAHALGNNVIMLTQDDTEAVPFDLKNYKIIKYDVGKFGSAERLKNDIKRTIDALADWTKKPSNPVQDFLSPEARPVPIRDHLAVKQALEVAQQELSNVGTRLEQYKTQEDELQRLREENARLQGMRQFAETFFQRISGGLGEGLSFDELMERFMTEMDRQGEVTVSLPPSPDQRKTGREQKIVFRKVKR